MVKSSVHPTLRDVLVKMSSLLTVVMTFLEMEKILRKWVRNSAKETALLSQLQQQFERFQ